ncbi:MAG: twin-arginine translocation signal domain-containing protein [Nitrososphaerales archaeon]
MSISLSRRDAIKGAMAATAALAAAPYIGNLPGGAQASPVQNVPASPTSATAAAAGAAASNAAGTTVLVIKGDVVSSYSGLQSIKVQDAALASKLKSAVLARFD